MDAPVSAGFGDLNCTTVRAHRSDWRRGPRHLKRYLRLHPVTDLFGFAENTKQISTEYLANVLGADIRDREEPG